MKRELFIGVITTSAALAHVWCHVGFYIMMGGK